MEEAHFFNEESLDVADLDDISIEGVELTHAKVNLLISEDFQFLVLFKDNVCKVLLNSFSSAECLHEAISEWIY